LCRLGLSFPIGHHLDVRPGSLRGCGNGRSAMAFGNPSTADRRFRGLTNPGERSGEHVLFFDAGYRALGDSSAPESISRPDLDRHSFRGFAKRSSHHFRRHRTSRDGSGKATDWSGSLQLRVGWSKRIGLVRSLGNLYCSFTVPFGTQKQPLPSSSINQGRP
jgi:hypothetical protein